MSAGEIEESWIDLPSYVSDPFDVFLNGIQQQEGVDFQRVDRALVFPRELVAEVKMSPFQWFLITFGIGNYRKHDSLDVIYMHDGRRLVATGLPSRHHLAAA